MSHPDPTAEQIAAELADHLAASADELARGGIPADQAVKRAEEKFGDVAAVSRQCYWVQQGDTIMFRRVTIALVVLLCLGLIATTANSWLAQSRMTQQLAQLNEQLASLTKTQESLQDQQKPLSITGLIYDGDKSKPVANAEVAIARLGDSEVVRRVTTDRRGVYDSGSLPGGDYSVFGEIRQDVQIGRPFAQIKYVQGKPVFLHAGSGTLECNLDVSYQHRGRISLECNPPLKLVEVTNRYRIVPSLMIVAFSHRWRTFGWDPSRQQPSNWPIYVASLGRAPESTNPEREERHARPDVREILTVDELQDPSGSLLRHSDFYFPEGRIWVGGVLMANVVPLSQSETSESIPSLAPPVTGPVPDWYPRYLQVRQRSEVELAGSWIRSLPDFGDSGYANRSKIGELTPLDHYYRFGIEPFTASSDGELKLRVKIPVNWDSDLRHLIDSSEGTRDLLSKLDHGSRLFCQVGLSAVIAK